MDISQNYINMCSKSEEIQAIKPVVDADEIMCVAFDRDYTSFFFLPESQTTEVLKWDNDEGRPIIGGYHDDPAGAIWLPRQDQLQVLTGNNFIGFAMEILQDNRMNPTVFSHLSLPRSGESMWLAFVMSRCFGKTWNGQDWI